MKREKCTKCNGKIYELYKGGSIVKFCEHCGIIGVL